MPEHSTLTGDDLHEPKGVASASDNQVYLSDGVGSGQWIKVGGFGIYTDSKTTVGDPRHTLAVGVRTKLVNDSASTFESLPSDATQSFWNSVDNKHWPIFENDTYNLRVSFTTENGSNDSYVTTELDIGGSQGVILAETTPLVRAGAPQKVTLSWPIFTGATYITNGGEVYLTYQGTGSLNIYNVVCYIERIGKN